MNKEKIEIILEELKILRSELFEIKDKISHSEDNLLPHGYKIESDYVDLEQHGGYSNYYFISKIYKAIGKDWYTEEDAIIDAWNHYKEICNKK